MVKAVNVSVALIVFSNLEVMGVISKAVLTPLGPQVPPWCRVDQLTTGFAGAPRAPVFTFKHS